MRPIKVGVALATTLSVFYSLCTAFAVAYPGAFGKFVNAFFHGWDFAKLAGSAEYGWPQFFYAIIVFAAWGFAIGAFFSWIYRFLSKEVH